MPIFYWFFILVCLSACQNKPSETEMQGLWVLAFEQQIIVKDTFFQRRPVVLDIRPQGQLLLRNFANQQGLSNQLDTMQWRVQGDNFLLQSDALDTFTIIYQTRDSLVLGFNQPDYQFRQSYRRLQAKPPQLKLTELKQKLQTQIYQLQIEGENPENPIQIQFFKQRYLLLNRPQFSPFIWDMVEYQGHSFLMLDALQGQPLSWDLIELNTADETLLKGRFYQKNQALSLELKAQVAKEKADYQTFLDKTWQIELLNPDSSNLAKKNLETLKLLSENQAFEQQFGPSSQRGFWEAGHQKGFFLLHNEQESEYSYLLIEGQEAGQTSYTARFFSKQILGKPSLVRLKLLN